MLCQNPVRQMLVVVLALMGLAVHAPAFAAGDPLITRIMKCQKDNFTRLTSLDLTQTQEMTFLKEVGKGNMAIPAGASSVVNYRYCFQDNRFRVDCTIRKALDEKRSMGDSITAYDGKCLYTFRAPGRRLAIQNYSGGGDLGYVLNCSTLFRPYRFAFNLKQANLFEAARQSSSWDKIARTAVVKETKAQRCGKDCVVLEIPPVYKDSDVEDSDIKWEVAFSRDDHYYPVEVLRNVGQECTSKISVTELKRIDTPQGLTVIPMQMNLEESSTKIAWATDPLTLKVNQPIQDDTFVLPKAMAEEVTDKTAGKQFWRVSDLADWAESRFKGQPETQAPEVAPPVDAKALGPKLWLESSNIALGKMPLGTRIRQQITLYNTGSQPLEVHDVVGQLCSTSYEISTKTIKPLKSAKLVLTLRTVEDEGDIVEHVSIKTNENDTPVHDIEVTFTAAATVKTDPAWIDFGTVNQGALPAVAKVKLAPQDLWSLNGPGQIQVESMSPHVSARLLNESNVWSVELTLQQTAPAGVLESEVRLLFENPRPHAISIPLHASIGAAP